MTKTPQSSNKRTGYINVGITSLLYAQSELFARSVEESLNDFVHVAIQQRIARLQHDQRNELYIQACKRAAANLRPTPLRSEFDEMMGWAE